MSAPPLPKTPSNTSGAAAADSVDVGAEIVTYAAPFNVYGLAWATRPFTLATASFVEDYTNKVEIIALNKSGEFVRRCSFDHSYPATKVMWAPSSAPNSDLIATTGDYVRLWKANFDGDDCSVALQGKLNANASSEFCAPLTSFDWNETDPSLLGSSSIDTTCTVWDLNTQTAKTQLIAHDKEVYDIAFASGADVFGSVGADGSVRMFDLRSLEHSTILYETAKQEPLVRLVWNKQDPNYLATLPLNAKSAVVLDVRVPTLPVAELRGHSLSINALSWAPHSSCHICTVGEDAQTLIWDLSRLPQAVQEPILAYNADGQINQLHWSSAQPEWISIAFDNSVRILRV